MVLCEIFLSIRAERKNGFVFLPDFLQEFNRDLFSKSLAACLFINPGSLNDVGFIIVDHFKTDAGKRLIIIVKVCEFIFAPFEAHENTSLKIILIKL